MSAGPTDIILHQYDGMAPFSAKTRVMLGIKQLSWYACPQPVIMPKPHLIPLTGGYRKIPVMQIGADIWCDTRAIIHELERRHPTRGGIGQGISDAVSVLCDRILFGLSVPLVFGGNTAIKIDEAFAKDREAMSGAPFDPAAMAAAGPYAESVMRAHLSAFNDDLADGRKFLAGDTPTQADASVFYLLQFAGAAHGGHHPRLADLTNIAAWAERVKAIGHGERHETDGPHALAVAKAATPAPPPPSLPSDPLGLKLGSQVAVAADDYGRDPVVGELVGLGADTVTVRRSAPEVGEVQVHFPRAGFTITPA
jgi:glutathione S-transferase